MLPVSVFAVYDGFEKTKNPDFVSVLFRVPLAVAGAVLSAEQVESSNARCIVNVNRDKVFTVLQHMKIGEKVQALFHVGVDQPNGKYPAKLQFVVKDVKALQK